MVEESFMLCCSCGWAFEIAVGKGKEIDWKRLNSDLLRDKCPQCGKVLWKEERASE